jgi:hypothetical protein
MSFVLMFARSEIFRRRPKPDVPLEIYASLVDALYDVRQSLFIGALAASLAALLTAWKSADWVLLAFALAIAAVAGLRAMDMKAYFRVRPAETTALFRRWDIACHRRGFARGPRRTDLHDLRENRRSVHSSVHR